MSAAVNVLKRELEDQEQKLAAVEEERKATIEAGRRAQNEVEAQRRHVRELRDGIRLIEDAAKSEQRAVPE